MKVFVLVIDSEDGTTTDVFAKGGDAVTFLYQYVSASWPKVAWALGDTVPEDTLEAIARYFDFSSNDWYVLNEEEVR